MTDQSADTVLDDESLSSPATDSDESTKKSNRWRAAKTPWPQTWSFGTTRLVGWVRDHRRVGWESLHFVSLRLGTSMLVWLVVGIALALPAGLWILQQNMQAMSADWQGRPGVSVYFELDATQQVLHDAAQTLRQAEGIEQVEVISAEQALRDFKASTGIAGLNDALEHLEDNPLPASLRARFESGIEPLRVNQLTRLADEQTGVAEVVVEKTWLERLNELSTLVSRLGVVLGVLFGVGAVLVTASSVRLAIEGRLEELRVLKMVGATAGQVRRPFLYFGALYGFGGGVFAAMLIALTLVIIESPVEALLGSYQQDLKLAGLDPMFLIGLLGIGCGLGVLGAIVAVRQRLKGLEIF